MNKKTLIIIVAAFLALAVALTAVYFIHNAKKDDGKAKDDKSQRDTNAGENGDADEDTQNGKSISITVVGADGNATDYWIITEADYLQDAMDEAEGLTYTLDDSGMVIAINGESAQWDMDQAYWAIYVNDEYGMHGIDDQLVAEGDAFRFVYTPA